jgi:hypothetical protein
MNAEERHKMLQDSVKENAALRAEVSDAWSLAYNLDPDRTEPSELDLCGQINHLGEHIAALRARVALMEKGLMAVDGLINESRGVDGLHLNGDVAPWEDLRTGGVYEEWLRDYDAALDAAKEG